MLNRYLFLLTFLLLQTTHGLSQQDYRPGYYITHQEDTVRGFIDYRGAVRNAHVCTFKAGEDQEAVRFNPGDIKAYRFTGDKYYVSKTLSRDNHHEQVFLEYLVNGITSLYYLMEGRGGTYFLETAQGELIELSNPEKIRHENGTRYARRTNHHIGLLKAAFAGAPQVHRRVEKATLSHRSLTEVTRLYHDAVCDDGRQCIVYEKQPRELKLHYGLTAGVNTAFLQFDRRHFSNFAFGQQPGGQAGMFLNVPLPWFAGKYALEAQAALQNTNTAGSYVHAGNDADVLYDANIHLLALQPSLLVKYTFPRGRVRPVVAAGAFSSHFVVRSEEVTQRMVYRFSDYESTTTDKGTPLPGMLWGAQVQAGCRFKISNSQMFTTINYQHGRPALSPSQRIDYNGVVGRYRVLALNAGIYLK